MKLYAAICASLFGKGSDRPYRAAVIRLATAWLAAAAISIVLAQGLSGAPQYSSPRPQLAIAVLIATEIAILLPLSSAAGLTRDHTDHLNRLLLTLPIQHTSRSVALLLPGLSVVFLSITTVAYPLSTVALALGLPRLLLPGSLAAGAMAAFGLVYGLPYARWYIQATCILLILWGQYTLSGLVTNLGLADTIRDHASVALLLSVLLPVLLSTRSGREAAGRLSRGHTYRSIKGNDSFVAHSWFTKKLWRDRMMKTGFAVTLSASMVIAFISWRQSIIPYDSLGVIAAMLAAAFCSDARALLRRSTPPEIVGLKGTRYFLVHYLTVTGRSGLLAVSPLFIVIFRLNPQALLTSTAQVIIGVSAGLLSGTLFATGKRDVLAQSAASLFSLSVLLLPAQIPRLANLTVSESYGLYGSLITVLLTVLLAIEYKRNTFTWRISHAR